MGCGPSKWKASRAESLALISAPFFVSRNNERRLSIDGAAYAWRATGTDEGVHVIVRAEGGLAPGWRCRRVRLRVPHGAGAAVTPGVARRAVEIARRRGDPGGAAEIVLTEGEAREALGEGGVVGRAS